MTGLQYLSCERCSTVYAHPVGDDVETDARCSECGSGRLVDVSSRLDDEPYFTSALR